MRSRALLALLAGCGFHTHLGAADDAAPIGDGAPDAVADSDGDLVPDALDNCPTVANADQRDHDVDGRGDVCDLCPHIGESTDTDTDGDGVGDACDPRPAMPGDHRALWVGFYDANDIANWPVNGSYAVANGRLIIGNTTTGFQYTFPLQQFSNAYAVAGVRLLAVGALGLGPGIETQNGNNAVDQTYQCNLIATTGGTNAYAYDFWPGQPAQTASAAWSGTFAVNSDFVWADEVVGTTHTCTYAQGAAVAQPSQSAGPHAGSVILGAQYATAGWDYLFVVEVGT
jgi:hypothetical protein